MSNFSRHTAIGILEDEYDIQRVERIPTVDVVEVVRCKDCKYALNNKYNSRVDGINSVLCEYVTTQDGRYELKVFRNADDYCSYGERKDYESDR